MPLLCGLLGPSFSRHLLGIRLHGWFVAGGILHSHEFLGASLFILRECVAVGLLVLLLRVAVWVLDYPVAFVVKIQICFSVISRGICRIRAYCDYFHGGIIFAFDAIF